MEQGKETDMRRVISYCRIKEKGQKPRGLYTNESI